MNPGDTFRLVRTCGRYAPLYYAAASGDFNPIHVDPEVARAAGLDGTILQGMCTFAWLADACAREAGDPGRVARIAARFSRPVCPGDEIAFEGRCAGVEGSTARLEVAVRNGRGEEVLKSARVELRLDGPRPPAAVAPLAGTGRTYGPYAYEASLEKIRDFAITAAGGVPTRIFAGPPDLPPHAWHVDEEAARASPYAAVIAPPTFAAVFAMQPFADAIMDPANGMDVLRLLHGEQELRLHGVVRAGDRLSTRGEIVADELRGRLRAVTVRSLTVDARGAAVVEGLWTAVVR